MIGYIRTFTGAVFTTEPEAKNVRINDIAVGLSRAPRWGGHTKELYPVSAHCIYMSYMLPPRWALEGLMHDSSEAYLADIPSPFKVFLPDYKKVENKIMCAVAEAFKFDWPMNPLVKTADGIALYHERLHLFDIPVGADVERMLIASYPELQEVNWDWEKWTTMTHKQHAEAFRNRFYELLSKR